MIISSPDPFAYASFQYYNSTIQTLLKDDLKAEEKINFNTTIVRFKLINWNCGI